MLRGRQRRALPIDLGPASPPVEALLGDWHPDDVWISPISDAKVMPEHGDPAEIAVARDTIRLAFVTALQQLPARQRAALILCEVLKLSAAEAATVLDSSVASVNSALQRARATLGGLPDHQRPAEVDPENSELLARYVDAFQRYDMNALLEIIHEDAVMSMPPFELWVRGNRDITAWMVEPTPGQCRDSVLIPVRANGVLAWGQYKPDGKFSRLTFFTDSAKIFPLFGLPPRR
jgi:RNA polymerase sigma-70 factor (ECF subfamily)